MGVCAPVDCRIGRTKAAAATNRRTSLRWRSGSAPRSWPNLDNVEIWFPLALLTREGRVAHRSSEVILALFEGCRAICRGHRVLAELGIVYVLDLHPLMLIHIAKSESR